MAPRIEARNITKTFPGVTALADVSMSVERGRDPRASGRKRRRQIDTRQDRRGHLSGDPWDASDRRGRGRRSPMNARRAAMGIGIVHQEGSLVPQLSVAENIFAGRQPTRCLGQVDVTADARRGGAADRRVGRDDRPRPQGRRPLARAGADRRDRQGPVARPADPDPGRADRRADADRDGQAVRCRAQAGRDGRFDHLCLAPAGRDFRALPYGYGAEGRSARRHARGRPIPMPTI